MDATSEPGLLRPAIMLTGMRQRPCNRMLIDGSPIPTSRIDHVKVRASQWHAHNAYDHLDRCIQSHGSVQLACRSRDERRIE